MNINDTWEIDISIRFLNRFKFTRRDKNVICVFCFERFLVKRDQYVSVIFRFEANEFWWRSVNVDSKTGIIF